MQKEKSGIANKLILLKELMAECKKEHSGEYLTYTTEATEFPALYQVSNEAGVGNTIRALLQQTALPPKKEGVLRVALGVGEWSVLSFAEVFAKNKIDIVLNADIIPQSLVHMDFLLKVFNKASNPQEFMGTYLRKHPLLGKKCVHLDAKKNNLKKPLTEEILQDRILDAQSLLGQFHYLLSSNFTKYQKIFRNINCQTILYDITGEKNTTYLVSTLKKLFPEQKLEICFYSPSNCYDYDAALPKYKRFEHDKISARSEFVPYGNLLKCAKLLCGEIQPIVLFSMYSFVFKNQLLHQYTHGLESYEQKLLMYTSLENYVRKHNNNLQEIIDPVYDLELKLFGCKKG